ncbi:MAG: IS110 family transposase [Flavobacteriales bacterium]|nr:IS110 family transposase [Flavobacteriales bacterium]
MTKANKTLLELAKKEEHKTQFELIKSIPGFGDLSAIHILLEIGDIKRFSTNEKLLSYIGLTPSRHSSGEHERVGQVTPRGNKQIKKYLIEASWIVVRRDPIMMAAFGKLCKRMTKTNAIIRIAKKLVNIIKAVLDKGQPYEINYNL